MANRRGFAGVRLFASVRRLPRGSTTRRPTRCGGSPRSSSTCASWPPCSRPTCRACDGDAGAVIPSSRSCSTTAGSLISATARRSRARRRCSRWPSIPQSAPEGHVARARDGRCATRPELRRTPRRPRSVPNDWCGVPTTRRPTTVPTSSSSRWAEPRAPVSQPTIRSGSWARTRSGSGRRSADRFHRLRGAIRVCAPPPARRRTSRSCGGSSRGSRPGAAARRRARG